MIEVRNLTKTYDNGESKLFALNDVSFNIEKGEFVVILGASGSGKSTLLNTVSGLEKADSGSIFYGEREISIFTDKELTAFRKETVGFVFQAYYLLPNLNVVGNVKMGASLSGNKEIESIVEAVGLKGKENRFPRQLSGGEQQRVSIARALAKNPKVLFCDEPTGALDEETGRLILEYLLKIQKEQGLTIVMVTHNSNFATLATKVVTMNSGKILDITTNENPLPLSEIRW
ncbi:MAG: ABC transporter ATP-binding protein [Firmicutes bacterium]|nr:ABC transporter ATP-binding protein [Bacillota bacterium]